MKDINYLWLVDTWWV